MNSSEEKREGVLARRLALRKEAEERHRKRASRKYLGDPVPSFSESALQSDAPPPILNVTHPPEDGRPPTLPAPTVAPISPQRHKHAPSGATEGLSAPPGTPSPSSAPLPTDVPFHLHVPCVEVAEESDMAPSPANATGVEHLFDNPDQHSDEPRIEVLENVEVSRVNDATVGPGIAPSILKQSSTQRLTINVPEDNDEAASKPDFHSRKKARSVSSGLTRSDLEERKDKELKITAPFISVSPNYIVPHLGHFDRMDSVQLHRKSKTEVQPRPVFIANQNMRNIHRRLSTLEEKPKGKHRFLLQLQVFIKEKSLVAIWEVYQIVIIFLGVILFVYEQYNEDDRSTLLLVFEYIISASYIIDLLGMIVLSDSILIFLRQGHAWLDILSALPFIFMVCGMDKASVLNPIRLSRVLRVLNNYKPTAPRNGNMRDEVALLIFFIAVYIIVSAAVIRWVETRSGYYNPQFASFHDSVYFVIISLTTVGYGDITPRSTLGRMLVTIMVLANIVFIPMRIQRFVYVIGLQSPYRKRYTPTSNGNHILVAGEFDEYCLTRFLTEFYATPHGITAMEVVVLGPRPNKEMRCLLESRLATIRVSYIEGSCLDFSDLRRAALSTCKACFVLCGRYFLDPSRADAETILRTLSIRKCNGEVPIYCTCIEHYSKRALYDVGATVVLSTNEMRWDLLAATAYAKGTHTLVLNMFTSIDDPYEAAGEVPAWMREYGRGASMEVYRVPCSTMLHGRPFLAAADFIFRQHNGAVVLGVRTSRGVMLNPGGSYKLLPNDILLVLCQSCEDAEKIRTLDPPTVAIQSEEGGTFRVIEISGEKGHSIKTIAGEACLMQAAPSTRMNSTTLRLPVDHLPARRESRIFETQEMPSPAMSLSPSENFEFDMIIFLNTPQLKTSELTFHMLNKPRPLRFDDTKVDEMSHRHVLVPRLPSHVRNHIVVIGGFGSFYQLVCPLRSRNMQRLVTIVIVLKELPEKEELHLLAYFDEVYVLIGDPSAHHDDFERCKLSEAQCVIVMGNNPQASDDVVLARELHDFRSMMSMLKIQASFNNINVITVLGLQENSRFITKGDVSDEIRKPKFQRALGFKDSNSYRHFQSASVDGSAFNDCAFENLLCMCFFNSDLLEIIELMLDKPGFNVGVQTESSHLYLIDVPLSFDRKSFGHLFSCMLSHDVVVVGLYRCPLPMPDGSAAPNYIYTCPLPETVLSINDQVFILAKKEPNEKEFDSLGYSFN